MLQEDMSFAVKNMFFTSSNASSKFVDGISEHFPAGLRVLVVDDDPTCLRIMEMMLKNCRYEVTKCNRAEMALKYLRDNKNGYDIVISDVHMPDMDGFKLLEYVGLEMDLPVIMMSADDSKDVVMKGVTHGACDYLIKPVRIEALKNIWQHVVRKKKHDGKEFEHSGGVEDAEHEKPLDDGDDSSSANEDNNVSKNRKDEDGDEADERDDSLAMKKPRVVWSSELHQQFMIAVNQLGIDKAVPKKILELMSVPGLTRENVASHLQKYRLYLRRLSDTSPHQVGPNNSFLGHSDATIGGLSSIGGLDFQGRFSPQNLANIQAAAHGRAANASSMSVPVLYQRNLFSIDKSRLGLGEQNNNSKQINLLHGIPTNMDSKQLASLQQSAQPFGSMNMQNHLLTGHNRQLGSMSLQAHSQVGHNRQTFGGMNMLANSQVGQNNPSSMTQMIQLPPQPRSQSGFVARNDNRILNTSSIVGQSTTLLGQNEIEYVSRTVYPSSISKPTNAVDFSMPHGTVFPGHIASVMTNSGIPNPTSRDMFQEIGSERTGQRTFAAPNYSTFSELNQNTNRNSGLESVGLTSEAPHPLNIRGGISVSPSVAVQRAASPAQNSGQNNNTVVNVGPSIDQQLNPSLSEKMPDTSLQNDLFPDHYGQDDYLMSALLKEEGEDLVENEFDFDRYLDNLPS